MVRKRGKTLSRREKTGPGISSTLFSLQVFFVETKGTPLYHKHLSEEEIVRVCQLLVEKNGIRSIERITGHHRDTIGRLLEDLAAHAAIVNDYLLREIELDEFEIDEMWATIKKTKEG